MGASTLVHWLLQQNRSVRMWEGGSQLVQLAALHSTPLLVTELRVSSEGSEPSVQGADLDPTVGGGLGSM
jgi:hypothetical protein